MFADLLDQLLPLIISAVVSFVGWAATRALLAVQQRFGAETAELLRNELAKAMTRGLATALASGAKAPEVMAANYVTETMPQTVAKLGASYDSLVIRAKAQLAQEQTAPAPLPR